MGKYWYWFNHDKSWISHILGYFRALFNSIFEFCQKMIQFNIQFNSISRKFNSRDYPIQYFSQKFNSKNYSIQKISKKFNSKKYSIQKFAKKFNSKFDSKCWIWQDSIQQYIHSITNYGYRSPLASTLQTDSSTLILSARSEHQQDRHMSRIGSSAAAHHRAVIWDFKN